VVDPASSFHTKLVLFNMGCVNSTDKVDVTLKAMEDSNELCVFGPQYMVPPGQNAIIRLNQKIFSFSGDTYKIINVKDESVKFNCKGKILSLQDKKVIYNEKDEPLFVMMEKLLQLDDKQTVYRCGADGKQKDELYKIGSNLGNTTQYTDGLKNQAGKAITLNGDMSFVSYKGSIWYGEVGKGVPIAKLCSPLEWKNFLQSEGDYLVEIAPGVDMALIVSMVLAYAEMNETYDLNILRN